jgi:hypothetical protein
MPRAGSPQLGGWVASRLARWQLFNRFLFSRRVSKPRSPFGRLLEQYGEHPDKKRHPNIPKQCFRCRNKSCVH